MSAWYAFASLGLYPIAGDDDYLVASPLWTRATLHLEGGDLVLDAPDASVSAIYVRELRWNDAAVARDRVGHAAIAGGGTLRFEMVGAPTP
jgi:putative alpha-1,2-mannosidase